MTEIDVDNGRGQEVRADRADRPKSRRRRARLIGFAVGTALALVAAMIVSRLGDHPDRADQDLADPANQPVSFDRPVRSAAQLEDVNGVRIESVSLSGAGGLIDVRFFVVDANKAAAVHDPAHPPVIVDEETGLVVNELLMGHSHTGEYRAGAKYYLIFVNPGNVVQQGSQVSVLLGNTQVEDIVVG